MRTRSVPLNQLRADTANARRHDKRNVDVLKASLERWSQVEPLVVQKGTMRVIGGNGRLEAMKALGWEKAACYVVDVDDVQAAALAITLNRSAELAEWDDDALKATLESLDAEGWDLKPLGWDDDEWGAEPPELEEPPMPEDIPDPVAKVGDVWVLGDHRVACGDATDAKTMTALLAGGGVDVVFTDPPYGISIVQHVHEGGRGATRGQGGRGTIGGKGRVTPKAYKPVAGDDHPFDPAPYLQIAPITLLFGANHYASLLPSQSHWLVWDKKHRDEQQDSTTFSDAELIWTNIPNRKSVKTYRHHWAGMTREGSRDLELTARVHPTQKPVTLLARILDDYAPRGAAVLDPFLGSGSTLIACEHTDRRCLGIELDPEYVDVTIHRWQTLTGNTAHK